MTNVASRTPEGQPNLCPLCGAVVCIEPSPVLGNASCGDAPCPNCGTLLWFVSDDQESRVYAASEIKSLASRIMKALGKLFGIEADEILSDESILEDLGADSLDTAELVMALEEGGIVIPDDQAEQIKTIADVIAFIKSSRDRLT